MEAKAKAAAMMHYISYLHCWNLNDAGGGALTSVRNITPLYEWRPDLTVDRSGVVGVRWIEAVDGCRYAVFAAFCFSRDTGAVSRSVCMGAFPKHQRP